MIFSTLSLHALKLTRYRYVFLNSIICMEMLIGFYKNTKVDVFQKVHIVIIITFDLFPSRNLNYPRRQYGNVPIVVSLYLERPVRFTKVIVSRIFLILFFSVQFLNVCLDFQLHKVFLSYIKRELEKWNMSTNNNSSKEKLPHSREKK